MSSQTMTRSTSTTETTTITASDVREVMNLTTREITLICQAASQAALDFDLDSALIETSILALNSVISDIFLQVYVERDLVAEYAYTIAEAPIDPWGLPPDQAPRVRIPNGARIRLAVRRNPKQPDAVCQAWFKRLSWSTATPLHIPAGAAPTAYGAYASGGFGVTRQVLVNPKFDQPVTPTSHATVTKEGNR